MYAKLLGGPFDGRQENVTEGCGVLQLRQKLEDGSGEILHTYKRSKDDPKYFVYEENKNAN